MRKYKYYKYNSDLLRIEYDYSFNDYRHVYRYNYCENAWILHSNERNLWGIRLLEKDLIEITEERVDIEIGKLRMMKELRK